MKAMITVRNSTEAMENQTLEARPIVRLGSTRRAASLVNSTSTASSGLISMLTVKAPATAAKPSASPASGLRPTAR
jgi:hypothetical protein